MKKSLVILGLLVCSAGFVYADEVVATDVTQQVEIQNSLDKTNFENMDKIRKFNKSLDSEKKVDKIKFDKSVKDKKYKDFDKKQPKLDKYKADKKIKAKPTINDKRFLRDVKPHKPEPNIYSHRPHKPLMHHRGHHNPYMRNGHKPQKFTNKNFKHQNRRAYR